MATFYTPIEDGDLGRSATHNNVLAQMEAAILARAGTMVTRNTWTTMSSDATAIVLDVVAGDNMLQLMMTLRTDRAGASDDAIRITINDDVGNTYSSRYALVDGSAASVGNSGLTGFQLDYAATAATATAGTYSYVMVRIPLASTASARAIHYDSAMQPSVGGTMKLCVGSGFYPGASIITRLRIVPVNGTNFVAGCRYALYGMV